MDLTVFSFYTQKPEDITFVSIQMRLPVIEEPLAS